MGHSIKNQLEQSVSAACHPAGSKRSERTNPGNDWRIYSCGGAEPDKTYAGYLKGISADLGKWIKENYPDCRKAYQISPSILQGGRYGFGYITLRSGAIDGAKHGRARTIDLLSAGDRDKLREICQDVRPGQTIMRMQDGQPYKKDSVQRAITRACAKVGIREEWHQNKNHAIRKAYAQRTYDAVRKETAEQGYSDADSRRMAENYVSDQLGHNGERADRERLLDTYVAFRW